MGGEKENALISVVGQDTAVDDGETKSIMKYSDERRNDNII